MSNEMIVELTETSLQFIKLPDTYNKDIRGSLNVLVVLDSWRVSSLSCPQVTYSGDLYLPGSNHSLDDIACKLPNIKNISLTIHKLLHILCIRYGYNLINTYERTVTL